MSHKCKLCTFETEKEHEPMEHMMKDHAASAEKFMT